MFLHNNQRKIDESISCLRKWMPDLKVGINDLGTLVQISIATHNVLNIKEWHFLIIYGKRNKKDKDFVKVYFVLPNFKELCKALNKTSLDPSKMIEMDSYGNPYLKIKNSKKNPYDAVNILSSILAILHLFTKYDRNEN